MTAARLAAVSGALLCAAWAVRLAAARAALRGASTGARRTRPGGGPADLSDVTALIAIRSGDPLLGPVLAESVATLAPAEVLLLVDDDDPVGEQAARAAAAGADHVEVVRCPPPAAGHNPKVHKLVLAQDRARGVVLVLDDDCVLPPGGLARLVAALAEGDLVTAVPVYREQGGLWSRLVAAFVNGSALVTYLPMARFGPPVSVNGMTVLTRRHTLEGVGGFARADTTCDDYALARAYRGAGLRIVQTAQPVLLATTVPGPAAYAKLLRRWLLFACEVPRHDLSMRLIALVVAPPALTLAFVAAAVVAGPWWAAGAAAVLLGSALGTRALRRLAGTPADGALGVLLEPVAALLTPLHLLGAVFGPRRVRWRGRAVRIGSTPARTP